jgi:hypothetical protein
MIRRVISQSWQQHATALDSLFPGDEYFLSRERSDNAESIVRRRWAWWWRLYSEQEQARSGISYSRSHASATYLAVMPELPGRIFNPKALTKSHN